MSDKRKQKPNITSGKIRKSFTRKQEDLELKKRLLNEPELFITEKGSDEHLDKLSLIISLRGGKEFTLAEYLSEHLMEYRSRFYKGFYYEIARLNRLDNSVMDKYVKPECAKLFTIQFIYGRFPRNVFNTLMARSPWTEIPGVRQNKLFQYLSPIASEQLDLYIDQAFQLMKECDDMLQFSMEYSKKYRIHFQLDMFNNVQVIS